jgi:glycosyltransferase involved in cell wall biosynthesis
MKIAYVFDRPLPARETDSEQAVRTIDALARLGAEVTLVLPGRRGSGPDASEIARHYGVEPGFGLARVPSPLGLWPSARKAWHAGLALRAPEVRAADVVYTRNFPTLFTLAAGKQAFAYETYRPWPTQFRVLAPAFRAAMRSPGFLGAILHSHFARDRYLELGVDAARLIVAHNGHDPALFADCPDRREARRQLGLPLDAPLVVYTGHVNVTKGLGSVVDMARAHEHVHFVLVGSDGRGVVETLTARQPNVHVVRWQPFAMVARYLIAADVLLQPPSQVPLKWVGNTVLPMKLFLYLAAGRPIVAPDLPDMRELLRHEDNSLLVPAGDWRAAGQAIARIVADRDLADRLGQAALQTSKGLTWDRRAERVLAFLEHALQRRRAVA